MAEEFKKGDRVEWDTSNGKTVGKVIKKLTQPMEIKDHHVAASEDNPQYLVESEKTGKEAAHKPESLKKLNES
jgi:Hypervirulence associated proteins TUDOR domain